MKRLTMILPLLLALTACGQSQYEEASNAIAALSGSWETALNEGDTDALLALYASDAMIMPPNGASEVGHNAVRTMFDGMITAGLSIDLTTIEAREAGNTGYNVGVYSMRAEDGSEIDTGKFVEIWKLKEGEWRIAFDIWNSDAPAMPAGGDETHLMIVHEVDDAERWMAAWRGPDSRKQLFKDHGVGHVHAFHGADRPNLTGLVVSVSDMDAFLAMIASEEGQKAAAEDGVRADTIVMMAEVE